MNFLNFWLSPLHGPTTSVSYSTPEAW
jgi:uncharacterized protein Usg